MDPEKKKRIEQLALQIKALCALRLTKQDNQPAEIVEGLFQGSIGAALAKDNLKKLGITHVLTVADKIKPSFPDEFTYKCIPALDTPTQNILKFFEEANEFIEAALSGDGKVLVHCFAGKSRASSFVLAYLIKKRYMSLKDAFELVRSRREVAAPNAGFFVQLKAYEKAIHGTLSDFQIPQEKKPDELEAGVPESGAAGSGES